MYSSTVFDIYITSIQIVAGIMASCADDYKDDKPFDPRRSTINPLHQPIPVQISRDDKDSKSDVAARVQGLKKEKISQKERRQKYKRGSIVDRYRRASIFDEIVNQLDTDESKVKDKNNTSINNNNGQHKRIKHIQETKAFGVGQSHRARMIAFEMAANQVKDHEKRKREIANANDPFYHGNEESDIENEDSWYLNPYSVASMPEDIRKGFILKVFGILWMQIAVMIITIAVVKFTPLAKLISENYWVMLAMYIVPYIFLILLFGVRELHPVNLIVFSLFTMSLSIMIGLIYYYLNDNLFMVTMIGIIVMLGVVMWYCNRSLEQFTFCKTFGLIGAMGVVTSVVSGIFFQAKYWYSHVWPGFSTMLFGTWLIWDIIAIQIDLTPDEYIIGALDLYLDIVNLILWLLIGCLYCMEAVLKFGS